MSQDSLWIKKAKAAEEVEEKLQPLIEEINVALNEYNEKYPNLDIVFTSHGMKRQLDLVITIRNKQFVANED